MRTSTAETVATGAGVITLVAGSLLLGAPRFSARLVGVDPDAPELRPVAGLALIGLTDLVISAGLLAGRPRWAWVAARAAANPPTAAYAVALGRRSGSRALVVAGIGAAGLTVGDVLACKALRAAGR